MARVLFLLPYPRLLPQAEELGRGISGFSELKMVTPDTDQVADIAREAEAGALLLTHFSTSVEDPEADLPEAQRVFAKTRVAHDGETLTVRYPKEGEKAWVSLF